MSTAYPVAAYRIGPSVVDPRRDGPGDRVRVYPPARPDEERFDALTVIAVHTDGTERLVCAQRRSLTAAVAEMVADAREHRGMAALEAWEDYAVAALARRGADLAYAGAATP